MDMEQIRCVLAVVRYKTFLEASFQLNRSQSSVSKSIRRLEEELGIPLFARTTRKVELTAAGEDFVAYAQQMNNAYECILNSVQRHLQNGQSHLRIGSILFGGNNRITPLVARFVRLHPTMEIAMQEGTTTPLIQALRTREIDVAFVSSMYREGGHSPFAEDPEFRTFSCFRDPYNVIVSRNHPLAGRNRLTYADLAELPFITTEKGMDVYHNAVSRAFGDHGITLKPAMYCGNIRSVLYMVSQNLGFALLSTVVIDRPDSDLCLIPLEDTLIRDTQMVVLNADSLQPHIRAFYHFVKEQIALS